MFFFLSFGSLLEGVLIGIAGTAGTEGQHDVPDATGYRKQEWRLHTLTVRRCQDQVIRILRVIEHPLAATVDDERHQAVDGIAAIGEYDPEMGEIKAVGEIRPITRGMDDPPGAGDILHRFI